MTSTSMHLVGELLGASLFSSNSKEISCYYEIQSPKDIPYEVLYGEMKGKTQFCQVKDSFLVWNQPFEVQCRITNWPIFYFELWEECSSTQKKQLYGIGQCYVPYFLTKELVLDCMISKPRSLQDDEIVMVPIAKVYLRLLRLQPMIK